MPSTPATKPTGNEVPLSEAEQAEIRATDPDSPPQVGPDKLDGKRLRAIPYMNGTTIRVNKVDFANNGIDHDTVEFDFRDGVFTLEVGADISEEAADFLAKKHSHAFEYMN